MDIINVRSVLSLWLKLSKYLAPFLGVAISFNVYKNCNRFKSYKFDTDVILATTYIYISCLMLSEVFNQMLWELYKNISNKLLMQYVIELFISNSIFVIIVNKYFKGADLKCYTSLTTLIALIIALNSMIWMLLEAGSAALIR